MPDYCKLVDDVLPLCDLPLLETAVSTDGVVDDLVHEFGGVALR